MYEAMKLYTSTLAKLTQYQEGKKVIKKLIK